MAQLILVLGDQLTRDLASLRTGTKAEDTVLMAEVDAEASYVGHHKKKLVFVFSAMRHFAQALRADGWTVRYHALDDDHGFSSLAEAVDGSLAQQFYDRLTFVEAGEHRLREEMAEWEDRFDLPVRILEDDRFIIPRDDFESWAANRKSLRMEYFYREARRRTGLLMDTDTPAGGQWNYDRDNRKPAKPDLFMPEPQRIEPDRITRDVIDMVNTRFDDNFGTTDDFWFAVTRDEAETARDHFMTEALPRFGDYQDAMLSEARFLYHSVLAQYINIGLLDPRACCELAEAEYRGGRAPLNSVEGFIRQILGWREYVRGLYMREGPEYVRRNALDAHRALPDFYWTADTDMACVRSVVTQTREEAYAHHIQRLMITGNFALLAGIDPFAVHEWYLAVYADAYEWVEAPNVIGMALYADNGLLASKPYAASGAYINRMSNYCSGCAYNVREKTGSNACPFNSLYWNFLDENADILRNNPRMGLIYANWDKQGEAQKSEIRKRAADILQGW